jgi:hypothetical protein
MKLYEGCPESRVKAAGDMPGIADIAVDLCRAGFGVSLDFTPNSLESLDRLLTLLGHYSKWPPDRVDETVIAFGSYVGETVRRTLGATWRRQGESYVLSDIAGSEAVICPFEKIKRRIHLGMDESLASYYENTAEVVAQLQAVNKRGSVER